MGLKKKLHWLARQFGVDFYALKDKSDNEMLRLRWLKAMDIKTVLDIGANEGQFAETIRQLLPEATIYSFEPIPSCYDKLANNFKNDSAFKAINFACGDKEEEVEMNVNEYSPSSSLLEMNDVHVENFSITAGTKKLKIKVRPLDSFVDELSLTGPLMIKIDTQGYEGRVIEGGTRMLAKADVIFIELSYQPLYGEQLLFHDIYNKLYALGFEYHGNFEQLLSPVDGAVLQSDGVFLKRKH